MGADPHVRLDTLGGSLRIGVRVEVGGHGPETAALDTGSSGSRELTLSLANPLAKEVTTMGPPRAGQVVGGRYELVRVLGRGSMGAVWLAHHRTLGEDVALKLMTSTDACGIEDGATAAARFRYEAQVAARLSRKTRHVVRVTDHGHEGTLAYLVMELLEGQTLEARLMARGPLEIDEVAAIVTQIARGLEAAHAEGVLHRDLKPANVFLARGEEGATIVKLVDFGIARRSGSEGASTGDASFATARGVIVGTPGYMSPEQADASPALDARADLWSLAAIAYEALTGELPVDGAGVDEVLANVRAGRVVPVRRRRPDLPASLERFFARALAPRADSRFASGTELSTAFVRATGLHATVAPTERLAHTARLPTRTDDRERTIGPRSVAIASAVAIGAALFFGRGHLVHPGTPLQAPVGAAARAGAAMGATVGIGAAAVRDPATVPSAPDASGAAAAPVATPPDAIRHDEDPRRTPGDLGEFKSHF